MLNLPKASSPDCHVVVRAHLAHVRVAAAEEVQLLHAVHGGDGRATAGGEQQEERERERVSQIRRN